MSLPINNNPNKVILEKVEESKKEGSPEQNSAQRVAETVLSKSNKRPRSPELSDSSSKFQKIEKEVDLDALEKSIMNEDEFDDELIEIGSKYAVWNKEKGSSIQFEPIEIAPSIKRLPRTSLNFDKMEKKKAEDDLKQFSIANILGNDTDLYTETKATEDKDKTTGT